MEIAVTITLAQNGSCGLNTAEPAPLSMAALEPLRTATIQQVVRLVAGIRHRWTMGYLARFSNHRLQDIGFERDWDGSLIQADNGRTAGRLD